MRLFADKLEVTSGLPPKADIDTRVGNVRFGVAPIRVAIEQAECNERIEKVACAARMNADPLTHPGMTNKSRASRACETPASFG